MTLPGRGGRVRRCWPELPGHARWDGSLAAARAELDFRRCCRRFADVSNDVKLTVGVCVIVVAIFGSAVLVSHVMIELAGVVRADLQALRESMEAIACGELARNDDAVAGIESSNRPRQWPTADRSTAIAHPPVDASPNGHRYDGTIPWLARAMLAISRGESSGPTGCPVHSSAPRRFR